MLHWYLDSLGKKTGGYGHLYRKGDPDSITQKVAEDWLLEDITSARKAATKQLAQLPIQTPSLRDVLVSVCFQLGNAWNLEHKKTWKLMLEGDYMKAVKEAENSTWFRQTPTRVKDLQKALSEAFLLARQYESLGL